MLHAPRLCIANSTTGAALVRVALIHLAQYGETLLQPEASRQLGWRSIKVDPNQSWSPVKGSVEILKALGYQEREDGILRFPRRSGTEVSVLARLTLDMLVLAEELRLYLTGTHQYPTNISDLFFPSTVPAPALSVDAPLDLQDLPRPPSSSGTYSFMSAQSDTSLNPRPDSRASTVTDEDTETLQASVKQAKAHAKKVKQPSSSEEEITLKEELESRTPATQEKGEAIHEPKGKLQEKAHPPGREVPFVEKVSQTSGVMRPSLLEQSCTSLDMSSLPDLQSIRSSTVSLINPQVKEPDHKGSVTHMATPVPSAEETKDNPEEHIYEEIDVIRQQVQALRSASVPVDIQPPPLPPKKKVSSGGEDDSGLSLTYPHMEWTSASMPGSLPGSLRGGSTGARRKKRRAPMPPDFMPRDWKPYENRPEETSADYKQEKGGNRMKTERKRSLNPFYEDIDSVKEEVKELNKAYESKGRGKLDKLEGDVNPFDKEEYVVTGYVGKNPFYEDIDENEELGNQKTASCPATSSINSDSSNTCPMGSLSELQDSASIKAKRRAPKPPSIPDPSSRTTTPQPPRSPSSPQPPRSPSSPPPPKHPPTVPPPNPPTSQPIKPSSPQPPKSSSSPQPPKSPSSPQPPKSSSSPQPPKSPSSPQPPKSSMSPKHPPTTPPPRPPLPQQQKTDVCKENNVAVNENSTPSSHTSKKPGMDEELNNEKCNEKDKTPDEDDKAKDKNVVSKATKPPQPKLHIQHPTIPPPPPPPKLEDEDDDKIPCIPEKHSSNGNTPSLFDDIPYMDANEVNIEKEKLANSKVPQSPQYEIPELPGKDGIPPAPPLSPATMRQTALLLSGHRSVPFIDDSDLPPDCPPPPPPTSPPESPSETPKASPPDTPNTSPPQTPHVSPPETPSSSSPSSPITVQQVTSELSVETPKKLENDILETVTVTVKSSEVTDSSGTGYVQESSLTSKDDSSTRENECPVTTEQTPLVPAQKEESTEMTPLVPAHNKESEDLKAASEAPPPLPPKTVISQNSSNSQKLEATSSPDVYVNQSIKSSVSDDRYEIPESPKSPAGMSQEHDEATQEPDEATDKLEPIKEDVKIEDSKTEDQNTETEPAETEPAEERYEIPEVIKETALSIGPEGMPVRVGGPAHSHRMDLESVFGPPKPPRRRRNNSLPPPRPPKSMYLEGSEIPRLPPKAATTIRPASASTTTSSFVTASAGSQSVTPTSSSLQGTPKPTHHNKQRSKARKSWPLLFCDCMYVNCKNYDGVEK